MIIDDQLTTLVYFHLEERASPHLHVIEEDDFARCVIVPEKGIKKSNFVEFINSRCLEKLAYIYQNLQADDFSRLLKEHDNLVGFIGIDGSLIDAFFSMHRADYRKVSRKAKVHFGFDLNRSIPRKIFLSEALPFKAVLHMP